MRVAPLACPLPVTSLVALALTATFACTRPVDPAIVEGLTSGVWWAPIGDEHYVYEFTYEKGELGGLVHRVAGDKQVNEVPVTGVSLEGTSIKIEHGRFPSFLGEADLANGTIAGSIPGERRFSDMTLTRGEASDWPMLRPRAEPSRAAGSYSWQPPEQLDDGWPVGAPSDVGLEPAAVDDAIRAIAAGQAAAIHSLLIVRDGRLVVEEYFHGWGRDDLHGILSCTKSVSSLLTGIAIDQGSLEGVDVSVLDFFARLRGVADDGWEEVRLEHLLTMTMGLDWASHEIGSPPPPQIDRFLGVLEHRVVDEPGSRFRYVGRGVDLLAGVLLEATGVEADRFAEDRLFSPLGIRAWDWSERRWRGHPDMSAALKLRPRDMAKLGQLVLDQGAWQGRQVVSADWIRTSTRTHVDKTGFGVQYGYLWWRVDAPPSDVPLGTLTFANGIGSQFIVVVPDARLVVVTTGGNPHNGRQFDVVQVARRHLVPGID